MNETGQESGNAGFSEGRVLPVLQDNAEVDLWGAWEVEWRDVIIVDSVGEHVGVYNLTEHDLSDEANQAELIGMLEAAR